MAGEDFSKAADVYSFGIVAWERETVGRKRHAHVYQREIDREQIQGNPETVRTTKAYGGIRIERGRGSVDG
eukprot:1361229-Amorphochlora_amoeboformis.AAC.2